ncbi:MAG: hypothetical protein CM15mP78_16750 [Candidatus Poseidoniales archaeon]|nr:MAG: hypothetical protein CM15mP78_16750 [Candidatus Poseidoniales archaeon]
MDSSTSEEFFVIFRGFIYCLLFVILIRREKECGADAREARTKAKNDDTRTNETSEGPGSWNSVPGQDGETSIKIGHVDIPYYLIIEIKFMREEMTTSATSDIREHLK